MPENENTPDDERVVFAKQTSRIVTYISTYRLVTGVVDSLVLQRNQTERAITMIGKVLVTSAGAQAIANHMDKRIDRVVSWYKDLVTENEQDD